MGIHRSTVEVGKHTPHERVFHLTRYIFPLLLAITLLMQVFPARAEILSAPEGPTRKIYITETRTTSNWQLIRWSTGAVVCNMLLEHENWPSQEDVTDSCGENTWDEWMGTPVCKNAMLGKDPSNCKGLFLRFIERSPHEYTEVLELPGITVKLTTPGCLPSAWCGVRPSIEIVAYEPLDGYHIENIYLKDGSRQIVFNGSVGNYNLPLTDLQGGWLEYWADSSYGDYSVHIRTKFRNVESADGDAWRFDLLGEAWSELLLPGSYEWSLFPPIDENLPLVLEQPATVDELHTSKSYLYLTGYLIQSGWVDAFGCDDGGLTSGGAATPCGETAGREQTITWQNRYDDQILAAARKYNVPARLLKEVIARESQFWPESYSPYEMGLGNITNNGADLLLTWNTPYYLQTCLPLYGEAVCKYGFGNLPKTQKDILRWVVLDKVGGDDEIDVLAALLLASAQQTGQIVKNQSGKDIDLVASYVDMWKITTGNYYAGSGCIGDAITDLVKSGQAISWDNVVWNLTSGCSRAEGYVRQSFEP